MAEIRLPTLDPEPQIEAIWEEFERPSTRLVCSGRSEKITPVLTVAV